jgi:hypothetical protein
VQALFIDLARVIILELLMRLPARGEAFSVSSSSYAQKLREPRLPCRLCLQLARFIRQHIIHQISCSALFYGPR